MRSNSGRGKSSTNLRDPTTRDQIEQRTKQSHRLHSSHGKAPADHRQGVHDRAPKARQGTR